MLKCKLFWDRVAQAVVQEAETRGVTVLLTERMSESIAVLVRFW